MSESAKIVAAIEIVRSVRNTLSYNIERRREQGWEDDILRYELGRMIGAMQRWNDTRPSVVEQLVGALRRAHAGLIGVHTTDAEDVVRDSCPHAAASTGSADGPAGSPTVQQARCMRESGFASTRAGRPLTPARKIHSTWVADRRCPQPSPAGSDTPPRMGGRASPRAPARRLDLATRPRSNLAHGACRALRARGLRSRSSEENIMSRLHTFLWATGLCAAAAGAQAAVTVGGRTFAENAFADAVAIPAVNYLLWDGVTPVPENNSTDGDKARAAMLDTPVDNPALATSTFGACAIGQDEMQCGMVRFSFTDNLIVNGPGVDFTVFDINNPSDVKASVNGVTLVRSTVVVGTTPKPPGLGTDPWVLNAADFDLSDFGLALGAQVGAVDFYWGYGESVETRTGFVLVGAVNSVPEPGTALLLAAGLTVVAARAARRGRH